MYNDIEALQMAVFGIAIVALLGFLAYTMPWGDD